MKYKEDSLYLEIVKDKAWIMDIRRELHQNPELSEMEFKTQEKIMTLLAEMGINHFPVADTGVCGVLIGKNAEITIGLRADIDALPIEEDVEAPYRSQNPGVMHACGHDAHTAILLGVARHYALFPERLKCNLKFFFQPAEETVGGAERMIEEDVMSSPNVDVMLGLHVMPNIPVGQIEIRDGKLNAASDTFKIDIYGKSAHGAYPEQGVDAIVIASQVILGLQTLVSRVISPLDQVALTIGKISGGKKDNIICDHVTLTGGMRTTDEKTRKTMKEKIQQLVQGTVQANGATADVSFEPGYKALINDASINHIIRQMAHEVLGEANVHEKEHPSLGVEDFSYFLDHAKGAFYHLGCGNEALPSGPLHSKGFAIDERALSLGVYLQVKLIESMVEKLKGTTTIQPL